MKKLVLLAMTVAVAGSFAVSAMAAGEPVKATKATIKVDGKLDDWAAIKGISVAGDDYAADSKDVTGCSFNFKVANDDKTVYLAVEAVAPVVSFWQDLGNVWNQSGIEIFFGAGQWGMGIDPDGNTGFAWREGKDGKIALTKTGFIGEFSWDMASLNDNYADQIGVTVAPGAEIAFSVGVDNTDSEGGTRTGQLYYPMGWKWGGVDTFANLMLAK